MKPPPRILGELSVFGERSEAERRSITRAILDEIREGRGIEHPPAWWRDTALRFCGEAIRRGADPAEARGIVGGFVARMDRRFDAFERSAWRWAGDDRLYPLRPEARAFWGVAEAPKGPPLHLGTEPHHDLARVAEELLALVPFDDDDERRAIREEGTSDA